MGKTKPSMSQNNMNKQHTTVLMTVLKAIYEESGVNGVREAQKLMTGYKSKCITSESEHYKAAEVKNRFSKAIENLDKTSAKNMRAVHKSLKSHFVDKRKAELATRKTMVKYDGLAKTARKNMKAVHKSLKSHFADKERKAVMKYDGFAKTAKKNLKAVHKSLKTHFAEKRKAEIVVHKAIKEDGASRKNADAAHKKEGEKATVKVVKPKKMKILKVFEDVEDDLVTALIVQTQV